MAMGNVMKTEQAWIDWAGGECPVPPGTKVEVRYDSGTLSGGNPGLAENWDWSPEGGGVGYRIKAYRVLEPAPLAVGTNGIFSDSLQRIQDAIDAEKLPDDSQAADPLASMLDKRGARYGKFITHAHASQGIKTAMRDLAGWQKLDNDQVEALEMIAHKIARILNGDPNYADSWVDIAGYAKLVADRLQGVER